MASKQKILIVLFAGSLVLPGVVWAGFSGRFDTENNENRKLAEFPEVNLESLGDFPEQFEAYYKDHVPFKNDLVKFCNFIDTEFFRNVKKNFRQDVFPGAQFRKSRSFLLLDGGLSLRSALDSIWRMRSRVTSNSLPTSSRV